MKPNHIRRAIGGTSALLALCWLWMVLYPILRRLWTGESGGGDYLFYLTIIPMMTIPGILALVFGIRLFRKMSVSSLKWIVGLVAAAGALQISVVLSKVFPQLLPEHVALTAFNFVGSLIAIPVYSVVVWFVLPYLGADRQKPSALIGRGPLILVAWELWLLLSELFHAYSPIKEGYKYVPKEPWGILGLAVPIVIAYGAYRLSVRLIIGTKVPSTNL